MYFQCELIAGGSNESRRNPYDFYSVKFIEKLKQCSTSFMLHLSALTSLSTPLMNLADVSSESFFKGFANNFIDSHTSWCFFKMTWFHSLLNEGGYDLSQSNVRDSNPLQFSLQFDYCWANFSSRTPVTRLAEKGWYINFSFFVNWLVICVSEMCLFQSFTTKFKGKVWKASPTKLVTTWILKILVIQKLVKQFS